MIGMKRSTSVNAVKKRQKGERETKEVYDLVEPADEPTPKKRRRHVIETQCESEPEEKESESVRPKVKRQRKRTIAQDTKSANFFGIDTEEEDVTPVESAISKAKFSFGIGDDDDDEEDAQAVEEETVANAVMPDEEPTVVSEEETVADEAAVESATTEEKMEVNPNTKWGIDTAPEMVSDEESVVVESEKEKPLEPMKMQGKLDGLPVIKKIQRAISLYSSKNGGACANDIVIRYSTDSLPQATVTDGGTLALPNCRVFSAGRIVEWDQINELRVPKGETVELDLGVSILLPDFYELELVSVHNLRAKYGLMMQQPVNVSRQDAMFPLTVTLKAVEDLAYIQKFQSIIQARVIRV